MKKKEIIFLSIIICILAVSISIKVYKQDDSYAVDAFKENTQNILLESSPNKFDVSSLKNVLKENEIIGLGDSTLGVREFDSIKLEILKTAVQNEGYRVLALHVDFGVGQYINDYVHGKEAITIDNIKGKLPWMFKDQGIIDMIQWIKQYNAGCNEEDKVSIYGLNLWDIEEVPVDLLNYLNIVDKENIEEYNRVLKSVKYGKVLMLSNEEKNQVLDNLLYLRNILEKNKKKYLILSTEKEYSKAYEEITVIENAINYAFETNFNNKYNILQRHMGTLIGWVREQEGANKKLLINATNLDISIINNQIFTMGSSLEEQFGDKYYSIGFDFYNGSCLSYELDSTGKVIPNLKKVEIQEGLKASLGDKMHDFGVEAGFVDIKGNKDNEKINEVMSKSINFNKLYSGYTSDINRISQRFIPNQNFHGLIFVDNVTASEVAK